MRVAGIYMTKEEEQEESILTKEIESWNSFEYAKGRRHHSLQQDVE